MNGNPKELIVGLVGLIPSTSYTFEFIGESAAGEGAPRSVPRNTPAPSKYLTKVPVPVGRIILK